jgi:hypothetical protein
MQAFTSLLDQMKKYFNFIPEGKRKEMVKYIAWNTRLDNALGLDFSKRRKAGDHMSVVFDDGSLYEMDGSNINDEKTLKDIYDLMIEEQLTIHCILHPIIWSNVLNMN